MFRYGPYEIDLTSRSNCKRLRLAYHATDHRLTMSAPPGTTQKEIEDFLYRNRPWIEERMQGETPWQPAFAAGERHLLLGQYVTLGQGYPANQREFERVRAQALSDVLRELLGKWTALMGVKIGSVTIRETRSRWGSCRKSTAAFSFSLRLARVPRECIEEVVVHELCHLTHPDHSPAFYALMTRYLPDWKERNRLLNSFDQRPLPPER